MKLKSIFLIFFTAVTLSAQFEQSFKWSADYAEKSAKLTVSVVIPKGHYLYANSTSVKVISDGKTLVPEDAPEAIKHQDEFGDNLIYPAGHIASWIYSIPPGAAYKVDINFQGCREGSSTSPGVCFMPASEEFKYDGNASAVEDNALTSDSSTAVVSEELDESLLDEFSIVKSGGGYLSTSEFMAFLNLSDSSDDIHLEKMGLFGLIFFVILGGLALNLTPCVLPMIPINLAIIGAGSEAKSKLHGFMKGGTYGLAIALSYGVLGLVSVLTGAKFGALNSSPVFNFIIAVVFILLSLGMFDIITIDFSRFSTGLGGNKTKDKGTFIAIFAMGIVAALLAGACVAPVVIAVLLYSATLYADGHSAGLFIPFLLGIGMALPWPIAGAGIAVMPKPGVWMVKVKHAFGVLIILFAGYYAYVGFELSSFGSVESAESSFKALHTGLLESKRTGKPLFIDFWANWCKNCLKMDSSTFKDKAVQKRLEDFVVVKFQAENIKDPKIKAVLDRFNIPGLPGFVILEYKKK